MCTTGNRYCHGFLYHSFVHALWPDNYLCRSRYPSLLLTVRGLLRFAALQSSCGLQRETALLPYGHYSVSRVRKLTSNLLLWFDFLRKGHKANDLFFAYNIHDIVFYFKIVFHSIMTSHSVAIRVYSSFCTFHFSVLRMGRTLKKY